ncbi:type IV pilus assembly protein PilM [Limnoglobus roseus]|uniref:Fimbrial assembly protein PilM n=1 Tax=Limnoglobus roseus TaxID=2598579 RepID=A0A5C1AE94_9BACT|nr:type IV pilus assembly protein PilM [Limnoglobus roseus]QEL16895.1 fimbrial assembly protein PilM [Limnoglobus roseus]
MAKPTAIWGLDMGQCALKALKLELVDGKPTAAAFDYIEHPKIMSQPDADPEALAREALEKFLSRNPIGSDLVAVSVAGQSGGLARFVKLPPVEESKIADIVKFEAKQQIPFPLEEVVWDFQKIAGGEVVNNFAMETEIGLFAMKREIIARNLGQFGTAGIECHIVQMAPLALTNYATYELLKKGGPDAEVPAEGEGEADDTPRGKKKCIVVLDVGTDNSNLIITDAGKIIWQRPLSLGGNHFTRALSKEMKLTFAKAEHLKRNAAKSPDLAQILKSLRPVLTDFVGEVQRSLGYFTNTHRDAHVASMIGLGSAFKLPGLQKYMAEKLSLKVDRPSKISRLSGDQVLNDPVFSENILTFPIAYGLALQGLNMLSGRTDYGRINTNLLPTEIRTERIIRAKKPYAAAAAAALLLGTGLAAVGFGVQYSAATDAGIKKAMDAAKQAKTQADSQVAAAKAGEDAVQKAQDEVKAIVAGADRRLDWIRLHQLVTTALPRAGAAGNLQDPGQVPFWSQDEGKRALNAYLDRVKRGLSIDRVNDPDLTEYLAQVNVQEVRTRYTDNLKTFLDTADARVWAEERKAIAENMPEGEREKDENEAKAWKPKAPEGGGWVVEIRGWTFHTDGSDFLVRGVVRNFQHDALKTEEIGPKKVSEFLPGVVDPLKGRISHVCLALSKKQENPQQNVLDLIGPSRNYIDRYLTPTADPLGGSPGGSPGGPGMPPISSGDSSGGMGLSGPAMQWQPLTKQGAAGAASGMGGGISLSPPGSSSGAFGYDDSSPGSSSMGSGSVPPGSVPPGTAVAAPPKRNPKQRTVFVMMFLWRDTPAAAPGTDTANPAPK